MKKRKDLDAKIPPPPTGLDEDLKIAWELQGWRSLFIKQRSKIERTLLVDWVKINIPAIIIAILGGTLLHLYTKLIISNSSLSALSIGVMTASAAILTVITAFLTFWFGSAVNNLKRTQNIIIDELSHLSDIKEDIDLTRQGQMTI